MADQLQLRGGTTAQTATFTGALREVTVDTDKDTLVVHDNALAGGYPLLRQDLSNLPAGTIDNADINASAAIVDTKLATIATAGKVSNSATTATNANTASAIVARDASGNFTAGTITAALTGAASSNVLKAGDTMTGVLAVTAGTEALPGIAVSGDLNTGFWSPTADTLAASTAGSERLRITSAGSVGIGTTPSYTLDVAGTINSRSANPTVFDALQFYGTAMGTDNKFWRTQISTTSQNWQTVDDAYTTPSTWLQATRNGNQVETIRFLTGTSGTTERLRITSGGNVGIGVTPSQALHVVGTADRTPVAFKGSGTGTGYLYADNSSFGISTNSGNLGGTSAFVGVDSTNYAMFITSNSERLRVDSSGRILVGTSSATAVTDGNVSAQFEVEGTTTATSAISIIRNSNDTNAGGLIIAKSRGTAAGSNTLVGDGDSLGFIQFQGADGTQKRIGAIIAATADAATGSNDLPTRLTFSTTADGASSPTERMRIRNGGEIDMTSSDHVLSAITSVAAGTVKYLYRGTHSSSTISFNVWSNGDVSNTNNSYGSISDIKLKENIVDANSQWDDLKALQVRNYNFKEGQTHTQIGLVAQEVELVSPGLVYESPDCDEEGNDLGTVTKSVNYSVLYMKAVKALQEAMEQDRNPGSPANCCWNRVVPFAKMLGVGSPLVRTGGQRTWKVGSIPARPLAS
jgi:hypothetical protein